MAQVQVQPQAVNAAGNQFVTTSLYVGDLEPNVTDSQLYDLFNQLGQVVSVRVCRDLTTRRSLGYGYVNYANPQDALRALEVLNFTPLNGTPIRVMYSHRDPSMRKSGAGNIFIKNLDKAIDHKALHDTFSSFGNILSCKVATDPSGQSKGYGFVQYDSEEAAQKAIEKLNGMLLNDKQVYVGPFLRKQEREMALDKVKFTNVFVKNLSESTTEEDLKKIFGDFGAITSAVLMRDADGNSKCFGFVNFENADDAARSVESLNGQKIDNKEWFVGKAQKKSERELELKNRFEQTVKEAADKSQGLNLYIKNLDDSIGDDKLKELFSPFGIITSYKVMRDPSGVSRGSGFVAFSTPEEASRALLEMNGKMIVSKPLYVAHAQRKEDRRARLQAQFSQMRPVVMAPSVAPRMPMYPPGGPGLGQQIFYGQAPPAIIPPQPGFGYQQQLVPGMRPGGGPIPNFFVPMVQQGQRPGGRRGGGVPGQQGQQPVPLMQQQMLPRGRVYRYPPGRGMPDVSMPGVAGGMLSIPYDMGGMPLRDGGMSQPIPIGALATALANASPADQRTMLGENLYPLVEQLEPEMAAKVTGMLLEMDQTEVLHLLESPEALKAKVAEAMEVLKNVQQQQASNPADQLQGQYPVGRHAGGVPVQQGQQPVPLMQQQAQFPLYPSGGSGLGQQMFRGQAPPAVTPPQQLVPGTRPGQLPIPNFFVPLVQQGQHPGGRHAGGVPVQQCQQPVPLMQQQMLPRGQIYHYPTGCGLPDVSMSGVAQGMLSIPYHIIGGMPLRDGGISQPTPIGSLASALSNISPADQRTMLG